MTYPRVLVVGTNPWIDNSGINTLINFFAEWDKDEIAHIYTKSSLPDTGICDMFFRISEAKVLRSIFQRRIKTGERVCNKQRKEEERKSNTFSAKWHGTVLSLAREFVWLLGKWKTKELNDFLDSYNADVLFFPVYSTVYMNRIQNYIKEHTKKPVVLYVSDDNYSYKSIRKTPLSLFLRFWLRTQEKRLFCNADKVMVITEKQKQEYDAIFGVNSIVMTKGVDFSQISFKNKPLNAPIKMVYTGKLIIGRWKSLSKIAEVLGEINQNEKKVELDIYTTDALSPKQDYELNRNGSSVKGALSLDAVQKVQSEADILVFVESLEKKYKYAARLSFSTKITDYLKSGKCIFAVGDKDIAPIDYFTRYDSAITATSYEEISENLKALIDDRAKISSYGRKAYECGRKNHDKKKMDEILINTLVGVSNKGA